MTIPNSVTSIGDGAFADCTGLTSIIVDASNPIYSSQDGVLYNKAKTTLITISMPESLAGYTIPDSVTSIRWSVLWLHRFDQCDHRTTALQALGIMRFTGCTQFDQRDYREQRYEHWG